MGFGLLQQCQCLEVEHVSIVCFESAEWENKARVSNIDVGLILFIADIAAVWSQQAQRWLKATSHHAVSQNPMS